MRPNMRSLVLMMMALVTCSAAAAGPPPATRDALGGLPQVAPAPPDGSWVFVELQTDEWIPPRERHIVNTPYYVATFGPGTLTFKRDEQYVDNDNRPFGYSRGTLRYAWTVPPPTLSAGQPFTMKLVVEAEGMDRANEGLPDFNASALAQLTWVQSDGGAIAPLGGVAPVNRTTRRNEATTTGVVPRPDSNGSLVSQGPPPRFDVRVDLQGHPYTWVLHYLYEWVPAGASVTNGRRQLPSGVRMWGFIGYGRWGEYTFTIDPSGTLTGRIEGMGGANISGTYQANGKLAFTDDRWKCRWELEAAYYSYVGRYSGCAGAVGPIELPTSTVRIVLPKNKDDGTAVTPVITGGGGGETQPAGLQIEIAKVRVKAGATVSVPVTLRNSGDVANMNYQFRYDPAVARPEGNATQGAMLKSAIHSANLNESGLVRVGFSQTTGLQGTDVVTNLVFRAVGQPGAKTELPLAVTEANDPAGGTLTVQTVNGLIEIESVEELLPLKGDCDKDGRLTPADASCALRMSVGLLPFDLLLDVNADRQVTSRDATLILLKALGR